MNKKLILCRHAEAEAALEWKNDQQRRLTSRGVGQAKAASKWLKDNRITPDLIHCSHATRARQTADLIAHVLEKEAVLEYPEVYEASVRVLLQHVNQFPTDADTVLLVGHNPGISQLASSLSGRNYQLGTAELVVLDLPVQSWDEISGS